VKVDKELLTFKDKYDASVAVVLPLLDQIKKTERLIDQIVYALYDLSEAEITLVEARLARPVAVTTSEEANPPD
jgi:hypothetical protein